MTTASKCRWLLLASLLAAPLPLAVAETPSGPVTLVFDTLDTALWDLSGTYTFIHDINGVGDQPATMAFTIEIAHDGQGRLSGAGTILLTLGTDTVAADYTAVGRVSGTGGTPIMKLTIKLRGSDVFVGSLRPFSITVKETLEVDPIGLALNGTAKGSVSINRLGHASIKTDVTVPLPSGQDGTWSAQMTVLPLNKLTGNGAVVLSNDRPFPFNLTGSYSSRNDSSKMRLSGTGEGRGVNLNVVFSTNGESTDVSSVKGKALGQSVNSSFASSP